MAKGKTKKSVAKEGGLKVLAQNKKARFNYHLLEKFEAGVSLHGWEIKSIRQGSISLNESFVGVNKGELYLYNANVTPYAYTQDREVDPKRPRKLLMHRKEIDRISGQIKEKGYTLVPTRIYLKNGRAKIEIALAKGKDAPDKRETIKERESKREMARAMKRG